MTSLKISKDLSLPLDLVTQTIAILAKRRAGKSYTMRRTAEQLLSTGQQIVLVDPKGDQWGIRSSSDGKRAGYSIIILGGEHADVPLEVGAGELVAKLVVEERVSILLDLSLFRKHEVSTFMTAFLENLYRLKAKEVYRTPVMLIIDEADAIAPQKPQKGEERMLGAAEDIVRRGGQRGIGCTLVTQRSAVLNKNVLTQAQMLVVLRTIAPQDIAAMKAWIDVHGTAEQGKTLIESLPSLPVGDAWFWSPGWPTERGIFKRVHVLPIDTFDSGATPKPGEHRIIPKKAANVDIEILKKQMAATIEKAKQDDPKLLRKRIAELERQKPHTAPKTIEVKVVDQAAMKRLILRRDKEWEEAVRNFFKTFSGPAFIENTPVIIKPALQQAPIRPKPEFIMPPNDIENKEMGAGERVVLIAIAQAGGMTREHITVQTGYKRSTRDAYVARLAQKGYVSLGYKIVASQSGIDALGDGYEPLPTGRDLIVHLERRLPQGEWQILKLLLENEEGLDRDTISETTGFKRSTRDAYIARLSARELVEISKGSVKASSILFL